MKHLLLTILVCFVVCLSTHRLGATNPNELETLKEPELITLVNELREKDEKLDRILTAFKKALPEAKSRATIWSEQIETFKRLEAKQLCDEAFCSLQAAIQEKTYSAGEDTSFFDLTPTQGDLEHLNLRKECSTLRGEIKSVDAEIDILERVVAKYSEIILSVITAIESINESVIQSAEDATAQIIETKQASIAPLAEVTSTLSKLIGGGQAGTTTLLILPLRSLEVTANDLEDSLKKIENALKCVRSNGSNLLKKTKNPRNAFSNASRFFDEIFDCYSGDELMSHIQRKNS